MIDFIEVRLRSGKVVSLNWDESGSESEPDNSYYAVYEGVNFDEECADGRVGELEGMRAAQTSRWRKG